MSAAGSTEFTRSTSFTSSTSRRTLYPELSANAALILATVAGYLLDRHIQALAKAFTDEGGFTEPMYRVRTRERSRRR
jgi:four helix bundle suffix protein